MQFVGRVFTSVSEFYKDINPSTLSGAIDVVVVRDVHTGQLSCSPFHVRFGKLQVLRPQEKAVEVRVNGQPAPPAVRMKAGEAGEAFFVLPVDARTAARVSPDLLTSPVAAPQAAPGPVPPLSLSAGSPDATESNTLNIVTDTRPPPAAARAHSDCGEDEGAGTRAAVSDDESVYVQRGAAVSDSELETSAWRRRREERPESPVPAVEPSAVSGSDRITMLFDGVEVSEAVLESRRVDIADAILSDRIAYIVNGRARPTRDVLPELLRRALFGHEARDGGRQLRAPDSPLLSGCASRSSSVSLPLSAECASDYFSSQVNGRPKEADAVTADQPDATAVADSAAAPKTIATAESLPSPAEDSAKNSTPRGIREQSNAADANGSAPKPAVVVSEERSAQPADAQASPSASSASFNTAQSTPASAAVAAASSPSKDEAARAGRLWWWYGSSGAAEKTPAETKPAAAVVTRASLRLREEPAPSETASAPAAVDARPETQPPEGKHIKSLRLPHELLAELGLAPGANTVSFTVTTRLQGTATCTARIFLWPSDAAIVVSDVDGTITKSDALGHLLTMVGRDWTHPDIAGLYTRIAANGYRLLYLTSRSLGQAASTRGLIRGVEQGAFTLPDGPVLMSPDRLLAALRREVVTNTPQDFKIACLRDVARLFCGDAGGAPDGGPEQSAASLSPWAGGMAPAAPLARTPFWAGFGNRQNDALAYLAVGIPAPRIFTVTPSGALSIAPLAGTYAGSYARLSELVDALFPPVRDAMAADAAYGDYWFWRVHAARASAAGGAAQAAGTASAEAERPARPSVPRFRMASVPRTSYASVAATPLAYDAQAADGSPGAASPPTDAPSQAAEDEDEAEPPLAQSFFTG